MAELINRYQFQLHPRIERGLVEFAEQLKKKFPTAQLDVMTKGFSSPKGAYLGCLELFEVREFFRSKLPKADWKMWAWFNILEQDGSIAKHNHWQSEFACAYHITGPGDLICDVGNEQFAFVAHPGQMVVFPGSVNHYVYPVTARRVSLSINAHDPAGKLTKWQREWGL